MRRALALLIVAAGLMLAACGGDDDDDNGNGTGNGAATTEQPAPAETAPAEEPTAGAVQFTADPNGDLVYEEDRVTANAGTVQLELTNESSVPHDVNVESQGGEDLGGTEVITGDTAQAQVDVEPGTYTYYCSVSGHREAGMEGTLVVE